MSHIIGKGDCANCQIRCLSIFADLSTTQLKEISNFSPAVTTYTAQENIYHEGDSSNYAFTLRNGMVKLVKSLPDGRVQIVRILKSGDFFGIDGFANQNYTLSAIALTDCELCHLPIASLQDIREKQSEIDRAIMRRWISNLQNAENMMLSLGAKRASERLASFLVNWGETEKDDWKKMPLSRKEIGDLLGLTVETVSRFLSKWKKMGIIQEHKGSILIKNKNELCEVVNPKGTCE